MLQVIEGEGNKITTLSFRVFSSLHPYHENDSRIIMFGYVSVIEDWVSCWST